MGLTIVGLDSIKDVKSRDPRPGSVVMGDCLNDELMCSCDG